MRLRRRMLNMSSPKPGASPAASLQDTPRADVPTSMEDTPPTVQPNLSPNSTIMKSPRSVAMTPTESPSGVVNDKQQMKTHGPPPAGHSAEQEAHMIVRVSFIYN